MLQYSVMQAHITQEALWHLDKMETAIAFPSVTSICEVTQQINKLGWGLSGF